MKQPIIYQSDCIDCMHYAGFGQCDEMGNNLVDNCELFEKGE